MRIGDPIHLESIEISMCGVFDILDKHNYVEIVLNQIEKKYSDMSFKQLHDLRVNSMSKYKRTNTSDSNDFSSFYVLDETMENINMWVKSLPLNDNEAS